MSLKILFQLALLLACVRKGQYFQIEDIAKRVIFDTVFNRIIFLRYYFDYIVKNFILRRKIHSLVEVKSECYTNNDCPRPEICNQGSCINACRLTNCGSNANCEPGFHSAQCICQAGFTGDPTESCVKCKR